MLGPNQEKVLWFGMMLEPSHRFCHMEAGWALRNTGCTWGWGGGEDVNRCNHCSAVKKFIGMCSFHTRKRRLTVVLYPDLPAMLQSFDIKICIYISIQIWFQSWAWSSRHKLLPCVPFLLELCCLKETVFTCFQLRLSVKLMVSQNVQQTNWEWYLKE